nr:unnamed protein product [Callosobruchus chinensis]
MPQHTSAVFKRTFAYNAVRLINDLIHNHKNSFSKTELKQHIYNEQSG